MFLAEMGQDEPGLNRLIRAAFKLLGLQTYFTAGVKEVRAWTIHVGDTAPQAAGVIHTDFERGFIRAQTIAFDDFIACKGEQGAKDAGQDARRRQGLRRQGRRRDELPVQRLSAAADAPSGGRGRYRPRRHGLAPLPGDDRRPMPFASAGSMPPLLETAGPALGAAVRPDAARLRVAGSLALLLAIPPGHASPLFPAAGIALAACWSTAGGCWPAWRWARARSCCSARATRRSAPACSCRCVPLGIALGAALQAAGRRALVQRFVAPAADADRAARRRRASTCSARGAARR